MYNHASDEFASMLDLADFGGFCKHGSLEILDHRTIYPRTRPKAQSL
jgi:hypothetical protein